MRLVDPTASCGLHTALVVAAMQCALARLCTSNLPPPAVLCCVVQGLTYSEATGHFFALEEVYDDGEALTGI
jgi:hypothetical protein